MPNGPEVPLYGIAAMDLAQSSDPCPQFAVRPTPGLIPCSFRSALMPDHAGMCSPRFPPRAECGATDATSDAVCMRMMLGRHALVMRRSSVRFRHAAPPKLSSDQPEHGRNGGGFLVFVRRARQRPVGADAHVTCLATLDASLDPLVMLALTFM